MIQGFLSENNATPDVHALLKTTPNEKPGREPVRLLAIGSRQGVLNLIYTLHRLKFAEVGAWSPLLPAPNPGEVMSILTWYINVG